MPTRRTYLAKLGVLCSVSGALVVGSGAQTSLQAARTNDVSVVGDASAYFGVDQPEPPKVVVGDGSDTVNDLVTVTNNLSSSVDITFTDLTASGDDIALHDGSGEVSDPYTVSGVGSGASTSINAAIPGSESLPNTTLDVEARSETGGSTIAVELSPVIEEGLVGYYPLEGDPSGSGGTATDWSGYDNDGTVQGSPDTSSVSGKIGEAFSFYGDDEVIVVSDDPTLDFSGDFTLACWATTGSDQLMHTFYKYGSGHGYRLGMNSGLYEAEIWDDSTKYGVTSSNTYNDQAFHQVTMVRDGTTVRLYVDGSEIASTTATSGDLSNSGTLYLGNDGGTDAWNGKLDDLRLYDRALSSHEIGDLYDLNFDDR